MNDCYTRDPELGLVPAVPLPFYVWQRWRWQKVKCACGKTFISRDRGLLPREYEIHYVLAHMGE